MRNEVVAGYFYPRKKEKLVEEIKEKFFNKKFGPGGIKPNKNVIGIVVPHAGYKYSGYVAANSYSLLDKKKTFIIIGPNHTGYGSSVSVYPDDSWKTPLGIVKVNRKISELIVEKSEYASFDEIAHMQEHSIEVQIPFLQYLFGSGFEIVPICLMDQRKEVAEDLAKVLCEIKGDFGIIASSDFTHYESQSSVEKKDKILIDSILSLDLEKFYYNLRRYNITACGYGAIATLMSFVKCKDGEIEFVKHMTSGDITGDYSSVVGYSSLVAKK